MRDLKFGFPYIMPTFTIIWEKKIICPCIDWKFPSTFLAQGSKSTSSYTSVLWMVSNLYIIGRKIGQYIFTQYTRSKLPIISLISALKFFCTWIFIITRVSIMYKTIIISYVDPQPVGSAFIWVRGSESGSRSIKGGEKEKQSLCVFFRQKWYFSSLNLRKKS